MRWLTWRKINIVLTRFLKVPGNSHSGNTLVGYLDVCSPLLVEAGWSFNQTSCHMIGKGSDGLNNSNNSSVSVSAPVTVTVNLHSQGESTCHYYTGEFPARFKFVLCMTLPTLPGPQSSHHWWTFIVICSGLTGSHLFNCPKYIYIYSILHKLF